MLSPLRPVVQSAYRHWFSGIDSTAVSPPEPVLKRWWGVNITKEEGAAFDQTCSDLFSETLKEISALPARSTGDTRASAKQLLEECTQESKKDTYEDTLGLIILLDQMSRNILRGNSASIIYSHFDRITQAVAQDVLSRGVDCLEHADQATYRLWFYMPLMHSEDIKQHETVSNFLSGLEARNKGNVQALKYLGVSQNAAKKHFDIIKQFGRYPHRNECLKRQSTPAEARWIAEGGTYY